MSGKLILGVAEGSGVEPLKIFTSVLLDCMKSPLLRIKLHLILDRIGFQLHDIILLSPW